MSLTALCLSHTLDSRQNMHMLYLVRRMSLLRKTTVAHGALFSETHDHHVERPHTRTAADQIQTEGGEGAGGVQCNLH